MILALCFSRIMLARAATSGRGLEEQSLGDIPIHVVPDGIQLQTAIASSGRHPAAPLTPLLGRVADDHANSSEVPTQDACFCDSLGSDARWIMSVSPV